VPPLRALATAQRTLPGTLARTVALAFARERDTAAGYPSALAVDDQQERPVVVLLLDGSRSEAKADRATADFRKSSDPGAIRRCALRSDSCGEPEPAVRLDWGVRVRSGRHASARSAKRGAVERYASQHHSGTRLGAAASLSA
jgi:hypothetical protein